MRGVPIVPQPQEMCVLRKPGILSSFQSTQRWKVTARYDLQLTKTKRVPCVRVSSLSTANLVLHLSVSEYRRLFKPVESDGGR